MNTKQYQALRDLITQGLSEQVDAASRHLDSLEPHERHGYVIAALRLLAEETSIKISHTLSCFNDGDLMAELRRRGYEVTDLHE